MCETIATKKIARPSICFVDEEQKDEVMHVLSAKYKVQDLLDVNKLSSYSTRTSGILILDPSHSIGVNTKLGLTSDVYSICRIKNMPQLKQQGGRSNRTRGACYITYFLNTEEDKE
jgi:hypothetical protein